MRHWLLISLLALSCAAQAEQKPAPSAPEEKKDSGFNDAMREAFPLSPAQINEVVRRLNQTREAATAQPPVRLRTRTITTSIAPGAEPIEIILRTGYPTSLVFSDSTGALWPIEAVSNGNKESLTVDPEKPTGPYIDIAPANQYVSTALNVRLKGAARPIIIKVQEPARLLEADSTVDIRVRDGIGPNAAPPIIDRPMLTAGEDPILMNVLHGVSPDGGVMQTTSLADVQAWIVGQQLYIRSPHELLSPAYEARMRAPGGVSAYMMPQRPVLIVSQQGKPVSVTLQPRQQAAK
jgi:intracellular multiplication protein IcmK